MLNTRRRQRGLSIVELMVGVTVGLFIVAAAALLVSGQLTSNRRLLLDAQLQQDLRAAAEIITRDIRRAGALTDSLATNGAWRPDYSGAQVINTYASGVQPLSGTTSTTGTSYRYVRSTNRITFGFDLNNYRLRTLLDNQWQEFTDATVMKVTSFRITNSRAAEVRLTCPNDCAAGGSNCWPKISVREMDIEIKAESAADATIQRSIRTKVRLRADLLERGDTSVTSGYCPA